MKSWDREEHTHFDVIAHFFKLAERLDPKHRAIQQELERYMRLRLRDRRWMPEDITRLHSEWYREFYRVLGVEDPYRELKRRSTDFARDVLEDVKFSSIREVVLASALANKLDFGTRLDLDDETQLPVAREEFDQVGDLDLFIDETNLLIERAAHASRILYLPDNCGEIAFDRLLIRRISEINPTCQFTVAGKSSPMINDVTLDELRKLGFGESVELISTGTNSFGAPESEVSLGFARAFEDADLVIAKGQAHLEFWIRFDEPRLFHIAYTKFPIHDAGIGRIPDAAFVVLHAERYGKGKSAYQPRMLRR
jgi:uncharacterized protein with ATP-grasp and redox domains